VGSREYTQRQVEDIGERRGSNRIDGYDIETYTT
jgi:hypothetical protein